jgi:hypothetical protein
LRLAFLRQYFQYKFALQLLQWLQLGHHLAQSILSNQLLQWLQKAHQKAQLIQLIQLIQLRLWFQQAQSHL